ncbi:MAG: hypothetical protein ABSH56_04000 [Bryobacteraceae bacterium]|jgi:hypothetical protein
MENKQLRRGFRIKNRGLRFAAMAAMGLVALTVFGFVVMSLWNWLAPAVFGGRMVTFWQALGLLVLARILFGGWHGQPGHRMRGRMLEKWAEMTPEERERFRQGLGGTCERARQMPHGGTTSVSGAQ